MAETRTLRVRLVKGLMGTKQAHRATIRGLGLRWRNHTVELPDTPVIRGMINRVSYLVEVTEAAQAGARVAGRL